MLMQEYHIAKTKWNWYEPWLGLVMTHTVHMTRLWLGPAMTHTVHVTILTVAKLDDQFSSFVYKPTPILST